MRVQAIPLESLNFDKENPRVHDEENMEAIGKSLTAFGQVEPLVVQRSSRMVIAGNGRLRAMMNMEWESAKCVLLDVDDRKARELSIALNRSGELAGWNQSILAGHLTALADLDDFDPENIGFSAVQMKTLVDSFEDTTKDLEKVVEDTLDSALPPGTQPVSMPSAKMREVKVFLDPDEYNGFQMALRTLSDYYGTDNLSDTVREAVHRGVANMDKDA